MTSLREKIAQIVKEAEPPFGMDEAINGRAVADAILAIPMIAEALASYAVVMARTLEDPCRKPNPVD